MVNERNGIEISSFVKVLAILLAKYHLHDGWTLAGSCNSRIQMDFASSSVDLHELRWIGFLYAFFRFSKIKK